MCGVFGPEITDFDVKRRGLFFCYFFQLYADIEFITRVRSVVL